MGGEVFRLGEVGVPVAAGSVRDDDHREGAWALGQVDLDRHRPARGLGLFKAAGFEKPRAAAFRLLLRGPRGVDEVSEFDRRARE